MSTVEPQYGKAKETLTSAAEDCRTTKETADKQAKFLAIEDDCKKAIKALDDHGQKAGVSTELAELKTKLLEAQTLATAKVEDATVALNSLLKECDKTRLKADMQANLKSPVPDSGFIKVLMAESGGTDLLDDLVSKADSENRAFLGAALEARFDLEMEQYLCEDYGGGASDRRAADKSVKCIYDLLLKVPESHAKTNPKMAKIIRYQEDIGGAAYGGGVTYLNCGRTGVSGSHDQGAELAGPDFFPDGVEDECKPANDDSVTYFNWATLHEVGHAVDDNKSFMTSHMGKDQTDFGAWEDYDNNVDEPANAAHGEFGYDLAYIKAKLKGDPLPVVTKPSGKEDSDWQKEKEAVDKWCEVVSKEGLWWDGAATKEVAIDGRVYQIAYEGRKWVSYDLAARSKGIHGYQFRAPGEWFAELYAAYYCGKLKPEHPAVKDWLPASLG